MALPSQVGAAKPTATAELFTTSVPLPGRFPVWVVPYHNRESLTHVVLPFRGLAMRAYPISRSQYRYPT